MGLIGGANFEESLDEWNQKTKTTQKFRQKRR